MASRGEKTSRGQARRPAFLQITEVWGTSVALGIAAQSPAHFCCPFRVSCGRESCCPRGASKVQLPSSGQQGLSFALSLHRNGWACAHGLTALPYMHNVAVRQFWFLLPPLGQGPLLFLCSGLSREGSFAEGRFYFCILSLAFPVTTLRLAPLGRTPSF